MAMSVGDRREGDPVSEINTTPLIDVMLVLLVMLIIALPPRRHAIKLDTPVPCELCEPPGESPRPIKIVVDFDGRIRWNGEEVTRVELDRLLAVEGKRAIQPEIHIVPNRIAKYGGVAHVMAAAQRNKLVRMGIVGGSPPPTPKPTSARQSGRGSRCSPLSTR